MPLALLARESNDAPCRLGYVVMLGLHMPGQPPCETRAGQCRPRERPFVGYPVWSSWVPVGPPGIPVVGRCRRGTRGCPGMLSERRELHLSISRAAGTHAVHNRPNQARTRLGEYRGAIATGSEATLKLVCSLPPRVCRGAQSKERRLRRDYATASAKGRPTPCRQPEDRRPKSPTAVAAAGAPFAFWRRLAESAASSA